MPTDGPGPARVVSFASLGSTNDEALARAAAGERGPTWIVAREQTGGRGRLGRTWSSPPGNLYASILFETPGPAARAAELGFVAGVALARAVADVVGRGPRLTLKWPNDLTHEGAKLSGLLLEAAVPRDGARVTVAGFGVNCASHPDGLAYPTTDLSTIAGRAVDPDDVLAALMPRFAQTLALWDGGAGFSRVRALWLDHAAPAGAPIRVDTGAGRIDGRFQGIDMTGRLVVETATGTEVLLAGDVHLFHDTRAARGRDEDHL